MVREWSAFETKGLVERNESSGGIAGSAAGHIFDKSHRSGRVVFFRVRGADLVLQQLTPDEHRPDSDLSFSQMKFSHRILAERRVPAVLLQAPRPDEHPVLDHDSPNGNDAMTSFAGFNADDLGLVNCAQDGRGESLQGVDSKMFKFRTPSSNTMFKA